MVPTLMRTFLIWFLIGLPLSLLLNVGYIFWGMRRFMKAHPEAHGLGAVSGSLGWFLMYVVVGALLIAAVAVPLRRALQ